MPTTARSISDTSSPCAARKRGKHLDCRLAGIVALLCLSILTGLAQPTDVPVVAPSQSLSRQGKQKMLLIMGGVAVPLAKKGLTEYWKNGPSGSVMFMVSVDRVVSIGAGFDASLLYFKSAAFEERYPGVQAVPRNLSFMNVYVAIRADPFVGRRFAPFFGASIGASQMSEAVDQRIVDSVRVTYYSIRNRTRLAVGLHAGLELILTRWLALEAEAKSLFVNNDPAVGIGAFFRSGVQFTL